MKEAPVTLLISTDDGISISAQEMVQLTKPWKDCFAAIYLLCGMDAVMAWPKLCVLRGREPFQQQRVYYSQKISDDK